MGSTDNTPAVDRVALIRELHRHIGAHASIVANDLLASGILRDADEVRREEYRKKLAEQLDWSEALREEGRAEVRGAVEAVIEDSLDPLLRAALSDPDGAALKKVKADAWDECAAVERKYRHALLAFELGRTDVEPEEPANPYRTGEGESDG